MNILKDINKLKSIRAFWLGFVLAIIVYCFIGTLILINIKYNNPFGGLALPILGIITTYIAYQQYKINKYQLKLSLYSKRFEIFNSIRDLLIEIYQKARVKNTYSNFIIKTDDSNFLFNQDIVSYVEEMRLKINKLNFINDRLDDQNLSIGEERTKLSKEKYDLLGWFHDELNINIHNRFHDYLNINNVK